MNLSLQCWRPENGHKAAAENSDNPPVITTVAVSGGFGGVAETAASRSLTHRSSEQRLFWVATAFLPAGDAQKHHF